MRVEQEPARLLAVRNGGVNEVHRVRLVLQELPDPGDQAFERNVRVAQAETSIDRLFDRRGEGASEGDGNMFGRDGIGCHEVALR